MSKRSAAWRRSTSMSSAPGLTASHPEQRHIGRDDRSNRGTNCSIPPPKGFPKGEGGRCRSWTGGGRVGDSASRLFHPARLASLGTLPLRGRDGVCCPPEQNP